MLIEKLQKQLEEVRQKQNLLSNKEQLLRQMFQKLEAEKKN